MNMPTHPSTYSVNYAYTTTSQCVSSILVAHEHILHHSGLNSVMGDECEL